MPIEGSSVRKAMAGFPVTVKLCPDDRVPHFRTGMVLVLDRYFMVRRFTAHMYVLDSPFHEGSQPVVYY